ncbi:hypothetical protein KP509_03G099000 [Ceratopteris richardii]|uniref:ATP-dependent RNA helicase n=1 Tax=Ceratopteris richardii TaxID=49495 RepID=A0A8T2V2G7_CERRI|nr:hypothetical protein KP509_03G099000 [Ceratopteris richardii]
MLEGNGGLSALRALGKALLQSTVFSHAQRSNKWQRSFHSFENPVARKLEAYDATPEAIARAEAAVFEIGKLLLGSKEELRKSLKCAEVHTPNSISIAESSFYSYSLSPFSTKAMSDDFGYKTLTNVQETTIRTILEGNDVVVKGKAGSGKTIAYLLPAVELLLEAWSSSKSCEKDIHSLILCPSRELALQIFTQAQTLLRYHSNFTARVLTGGFRISKERERFQSCPCQMVIATPGRLLDHLEKTEGFKERLGNLKLLILDEADHILDVRFRKTVEDILQFLPLVRQTLLFSTTIPSEIRSISKIALKDGHKCVDMIDIDNSTAHEQVNQKCVVAQMEKHLPVMYAILKEHIHLMPNYKVLVFCVTARVTAFMYQLFKDLGFNCVEIHSKKSQTSRFHTYRDFRDSEGATIMFTSDVSSRGLDYPNVTLVVQIGLPERGGTYINRIGRTGRSGKDGESLLLLAPWEEYFLQKLQNQSIELVPAPDFEFLTEAKISSTLASLDPMLRWHAYRTWLGYYLSLTNLPLSKEKIVEHANSFSSTIGFEKPPLLSRNLIKKMGLRGVKGLTRKRKEV